MTPGKAVHRLRVLAICMGLTGLAFRQDPGFVTPDTKVDLTVDPIGMLSRSLQLWDPAGNFGQLQNQAYGYLWPMGPLHALGSLLGMPAWVIQRLWWALLLCVAFTGVVKLAARLNIGAPGSRLIAGVAFALSVRTLTELGGISVEAWPSAVAPWVLVPLAGLPAGARLRKPIAWSALAVACAGGVNATAVFAVVPLAILWLFSLQSTRQRLTAVVGWCAAVALATLWWVLPLLLLAGYAPPFLNFIETAGVTTQVTDVPTMLQGASHWQAYFSDIYGPVWPAGKRLASEPLLLWATTMVAAMGLAGLARRGMPHRRFLVTGLLLGLAMVGFGHVAVVGGVFSEWQRGLLDGVAVAFRNVHKFDVVIRLPLAMGLAHLVGIFMAASTYRPQSERARLRAIGVTAVAVLAVLGVASPALAGGLAARGKYVSVPAYWRQAASWLDKNLGDDRVLVIPGARFGDYRWGSTGDEVIQSLLDGRWGVRNTIPLTPPGTIRYLDAIELAISTGQGSPGLADLLARSGVRYVLVRSDIDYGKSGSVAPIVVRQALSRSPGLNALVQFGPQVGAQVASGAFLDRGLAGPVPALEIFEVQRPVKQVVAHEVSDVTTVVGGPESLLALASAGSLPAGPVILAGDLPAAFPVGNVVVTDTLRKREVNFGLARDNASATFDATQERRGAAPAADYLPSWADANRLTVVGYAGIAGVSASSSWSDIPGLIGNRPEHNPFAAVDGDPSTSWRTPPGFSGENQWLEIRFSGPRVLREMTISFDQGAEQLPIRLIIDAGANQLVHESFAGTTTVNLIGQPPTASIRIFVDKTVPRGSGEGAVGIAEVEIPGLTAARHLVVPVPPATGQVSQLMFSAAPSSSSCYFLANATYCDPARARSSEDGNLISRFFTLPAQGSFTPVLWARPRPGVALDNALSVSKLHTTAASSSATAEPTGSPGAVIDGDAATAWRPDFSDEHPWLRMNWTQEREITGLLLTLAPGIAASRPWGVQVVGDGGIRTGVVDANGVVSFNPAMTTDEITIFFLGSLEAFSRNPYQNRVEKLEVAVGEIAALPEGPRPLPNPDEVITLPCGSGPTLRVGPQARQTAITATRRQLRELQEVPAVLCGTDKSDFSLVPGQHLMVAEASPLSLPVRTALFRSGTKVGASSDSPVLVDRWGPTDRRLTLPVSGVARVLSVRENKNPGWRATAGGRELTAITLDGWQQGWLVPAGVGGQVVLTFTPEWNFRIALLVGAGALGLLVLAAVLPGDRRPAYVSGRHRFRREGLYLVGGLALLIFGGLAGALLTIAGVLGYFVSRFLTGRVPQHDQVKLKRSTRWLWLLPPAMFIFSAWLANGTEDRHQAPWPQLVGIASVVTLWLLAYWPRRAGARPAPIDGWSFEAVPAGRGEDKATRHGKDIHPERVAAEGGNA